MNFSSCLIVRFLLLIVSSLMMCSAFPNHDASHNSFRDKRQHGHGVTGPVHTFVKTDKNANFKWGVRHHVGHHYAGKR